MTEIELLQRKLERERRARQAAEEIAEVKTRELYRTNQELRQLADELEARVQSRTQELGETLSGLQRAKETLETINRALRAREAEAYKLSQVASRTDNMVIITDAEGRVEWVNEAFSATTGYSLAEMMGRKPGHLLQGPNTNPDTVALMSARLSDRQGFNCEVVNYSKSGREYWVAIDAQPVHDSEGRTVNFIALERDISERKAFEQALATARDEAMRASRLKSEFLATMSHEIRTPMNGIIGMAELLLDTPLDLEQREFAGIILNEGRHLLEIINDILDFSKIEAGQVQLDLSDFDLALLIERLTDVLAMKAQEQDTSLMTFIDPAIPALVRGDAGRLRQILLNLASNAVKFTQGGEVEISATLEKRSAGHVDVRFEVTDTGIGMPPDVLARIREFRPFTQADSSITRRYGGTGLGLPISNGLVGLMQGDLGVESQAGAGSCFWFTVPLAISPASPPVAVDWLQPAMHDLRILVVDDNPTHRRILGRYLSSWGMRSTQASGGQEALYLLRQAVADGSPYHIALIDMVMPELDGMGLAQAVKQDFSLASTQLILITAYDADKVKSQASEVGFVALLDKPVRQSQLLDTITNTASRLADRIQARDKEVALPPGPGNIRGSGPLILVAEDNRTNQIVARRQLQRLGYSTHIVGDGLEALEALRANRDIYSLVLMDVQMPRLDGLEATRRIRHTEEGSGHHTTIIAMTANAMKGDRERCLEAGMDDYISKPVRLEALRRTLERWRPAEKGE